MNKENKAKNQEIREELSPEATNNPLSWANYAEAVGKIVGFARLFARKYPEDAEQIKYWIALEAAVAEREGKTKKEIRNLIKELYREAARQFGFKTKMRFHMEPNTWMEDIKENHGHHIFKANEYKTEEEYPRCGVSNCDDRGVLHDAKFGRLCSNCYHFVRNRVKKGEPDPYRDIEKDRKFTKNSIAMTKKGDRHTKENSSFWELVHKNVDDNKWQQLWWWAKGTQNKIDQETLKEVREVIVSNLENLPYGNRHYKKTSKRLIFLHSKCLECGEKYEIDIYKILLDEADFSYLCPRCSGIYSSHRLFRLQKIIEKIINQELDYKNAMKETGYSHGGLSLLVHNYRKGGLEKLAQKIGFPYFGIPNKNNDFNFFRKIEKCLQSPLHPENFL